MKTLIVNHTDVGYKFKIEGKDYKEVLNKLCDFLNGELDFPCTFIVEQEGDK